MRAAQQKIIIALLVAFAAARVLVYSAAFPLFNNVDEQAHVDLVVKYARGAAPRGVEQIGADAARLFALYSSPEYLSGSDATAPVPMWKFARDFPAEIAQAQQQWQQIPNLESGEPPLYYAIAACWFRIGESIGVRGGLLVFWVRFLNVVPAALLVWLAAKTAQISFPSSTFLPIAAATICAAWPQDAFYSVCSDGWSALWFGIAALLIVRPEPMSGRRAALVGVLLAMSCLTKLSALPFVVAALVAIAIQLVRKLRFQPLAILTASFLLPLGVWAVHNHATFGDWTATSAKVAALGWSVKPLSQWLPHALFTLAGAYDWWRELTASFWRGEFVWHWQRIASPSADAFYSISTTLVLIASVALAVRARAEQTAIRFYCGCVLAGIAFIILLSLMYDFDGCFYPSREKPYFTSGRLLLAALVPFAVLYARVLDWTTARLPSWSRYAVIAALALFITGDEFVISQPAFGSRFNFFQMAADARRGEMFY